MNWKIRQKLVCIEKGKWVNGKGEPSKFSPQYMFVYTFDGIDGDNYIYLKEATILESDGHRVSFNSRYFREFISEKEKMNEVKKGILNKEIVFN